MTINNSVAEHASVMHIFTHLISSSALKLKRPNITMLSKITVNTPMCNIGIVVLIYLITRILLPKLTPCLISGKYITITTDGNC